MTVTGDPHEEPRAFAAQFGRFLEWVTEQGEPRQDAVVALVTGFLGAAGTEQSVLSRSLPPFEHVNLQMALGRWTGMPGREVAVQGLTVPPHHPPVALQQLVSGEGIHRVGLCAPPLRDLPNGPGSTLACLQFALLLVTDAAGRYVMMVRGPSDHDHGLTVEVAGLPVAAAQVILAELDRLRAALNVYRGHVLDVSMGPTGVTLEFRGEPGVTRDEVVLPEAVLTRIERHAIGLAGHREALLAAGQHLKRGILLYGPPGTGKTHTTRYLVGEMGGYTRFLLTGRALHGIGAVAELARELEPSMLVLEDVDLVASDRRFGPGTAPVLFDLLDAMDGAAGDADLLYVLTTNRADLLEPALAARPGRVDVAVEIELPDARARERLLELYGRAVNLRLDETARRSAIERTAGVTASFLKELVRRATLEAFDAGDGTSVGAGHLDAALDDLLEASQRVTRSLLGVERDAPDLAPEAPLSVPARPAPR